MNNFFSRFKGKKKSKSKNKTVSKNVFKKPMVLFTSFFGRWGLFTSEETLAPGPDSGQEEPVSVPMKVKMKQWFMRLSLKHQILFIKQIAILIRAGVPLLSSLHMIREQSKSNTLNKVLEQVIKDVENGQYLATAFGKFRKIFGELTINVVAVGEISGNLSNNLDHLAVNLKKKLALRRKIVSASVYPIFIIIATFAIMVMMTVFLFPKIIPIFKTVNYDLPWTTQFLIFTTNLMQHHGLLMLAGLVIFIMLGWLLLKVQKIHFWYDKFMLRIPLFSNMIRVYNTSNICRTIGLLLNSGVMVVRAFHITSNTTSNLVYKKELNQIAEQLTKGEKISTYINGKQTLFPLMMFQMLKVGETTGKLSDTFMYLADVYEEEMDEITKNLSTTVEPLLLIVMGLIVGFVAISIITPIYGITQHLTPR